MEADSSAKPANISSCRRDSAFHIRAVHSKKSRASKRSKSKLALCSDMRRAFTWEQETVVLLMRTCIEHTFVDTMGQPNSNRSLIRQHCIPNHISVTVNAHASCNRRDTWYVSYNMIGNTGVSNATVLLSICFPTPPRQILCLVEGATNLTN